MEALEHESKPVTAKKQGRLSPFSASFVTIVSYLACTIFLPALLVSFIFVLSPLVGGPSQDEITKQLSDSSTIQFMLSLFIYATLAGIIYIFMKSRDVSLKEIGLGRGPNGKDALYAVGFFIIYFVVNAIIFALVKQYIPAINTEQEQQIGYENAAGPALLLVFIALVVLPPLVEEFAVRGFLYTGLRRKLSKITATMVASVLFGLAHLQFLSGAAPLYIAAIDTFVLSVFLIALRERTGSLWAGIFVHAIKNGLAFTVLFLFAAR